MAGPSFDREEILRTWRIFRQPGEVLEMRIPKAGKFRTISGYFNEPEAFANLVEGDLAKQSFPGIYFTINPVNPDLLARAANRYIKYAETTTSDADIIALGWLPIDIDAVRPAGISSTDEEHESAITKTIEIREWLIAQRWPENCFVRADSGNGGHLVARIELPPGDKDLIARCLKTLDKKFSDDKSKVDVTTFNPARIWKLYGTVAKKGDFTPERPHRMARLLEWPETIETAPRELIEALAAMYEPEQRQRTGQANGQFDAAKYAEAHGATVRKISTKGEWTVYELDECPFDPSHNRGEAIISVHQNGARGFKCPHNGCQGKDWQALKELWEPDRSAGPTVIDAVKALAGVCDGAATKDGCGFSKFDRERHNDLIEKAISEGYLTPKEEETVYRFLNKYKKQLKGLGINYDNIGHIARDGQDSDNGLAKINERIPNWIEDYHFKTVSDTERLYHYEHGVYLDDGEIVLKALIEKEFGDFTDNRMVSDIVGKVKRRTYTDRDSFNNKNVINVKNGLLDLETLVLGQHSPDYLSTAQIDVTYDSEAKAPRIQKFLYEVAQPGDIALIEELIGWLLWPDYNIHKALMLIGGGRNGKGTLLRLITAFLGKKSISNVTLQDLVADRFAKADLYGKLANIGGDLPSKDLSDTAAFRNLTGGDDNRAQEKYRPAFNFRNKAKMLFSANVLPRSPDDTYAFYSRWILLEFLNVFDPQKGTGDPDLDAKLQTPEELSGLLNIALTGLKRLRANGWKFSYDKTVEDVETMYKRNANPVLAFLMDECEPEPSSYIEKTVLNNRFNDYARAHNIRPLSATKFTVLLKDQTEIPVSDYRPYLGGQAAPRCWLGAKFKEVVYKETEKTAHSGPQSTPSTVFPTPSLRENESKGEEKEKKGEIGYSKPLDGVDGAAEHPTRGAAQPGDSAEEVSSSDFSPEEAALLTRICGRMRQQSPDKLLDPFILAMGMRANDHDIGIDRCKAWIASEAGA